MNIYPKKPNSEDVRSNSEFAEDGLVFSPFSVCQIELKLGNNAKRLIKAQKHDGTVTYKTIA